MKWWRNWRKRVHCPHRHLRGIYGDDVNRVGGYRLFCVDCGRFLDGPVSLADERPLKPPTIPADKKRVTVTSAQVSAARARVEADRRLGEKTPDWIVRVASLSKHNPVA